MLSAEFFFLSVSAIALQKHVNKHVNKLQCLEVRWSRGNVSDWDTRCTGSIPSADEFFTYTGH